MAAKLFKKTFCRRGESIKAQPRHVGLFYYVSYWGFWDKVLAVDGLRVKVVRVDTLSGQPVEEPRWHYTPMNACAFADRPFVVGG